MNEPILALDQEHKVWIVVEGDRVEDGEGVGLVSHGERYDVTDQFYGIVEELHKRRTQGRLT